MWKRVAGAWARRRLLVLQPNPAVLEDHTQYRGYMFELYTPSMPGGLVAIGMAATYVALGSEGTQCDSGNRRCVAVTCVCVWLRKQLTCVWLRKQLKGVCGYVSN